MPKRKLQADNAGSESKKIKMVDAKSGKPCPPGHPNAIRSGAYRMRKKRESTVDADSGEPCPPDHPNAILLRTFLARRNHKNAPTVDAVSGEPCSPDHPNAILLRNFQDRRRRKNAPTVDADSGEPCPPDHPNAILIHTFLERRRRKNAPTVDAVSGEPCPPDHPNAITPDTYRMRKKRESTVNADSGKPKSRARKKQNEMQLLNSVSGPNIEAPFTSNELLVAANVLIPAEIPPAGQVGYMGNSSGFGSNQSGDSGQDERVIAPRKARAKKKQKKMQDEGLHLWYQDPLQLQMQLSQEVVNGEQQQLAQSATESNKDDKDEEPASSAPRRYAPRSKQKVNPLTGKPSNAKNAIPLSVFLQRQKVDPTTGKPSNAKNAITRKHFDDKRRNCKAKKPGSPNGSQ